MQDIVRSTLTDHSVLKRIRTVLPLMWEHRQIPMVVAMGEFSEPSRSRSMPDEDADGKGSFAKERVYVASNQPNPILASVVRSGIPYDQATVDPDVYSSSWSLRDFQIVPGKPDIKNQQLSGYCWVYATACMVEQFLNTENKSSAEEVSIAYWQYWDVLEKTNYFLEVLIRTAETHDVHSRLMYTLLDLYPQDGGQYTFAQNLIDKYGFMYKSNYSRSPAANVTRSLNSKLRYLVKSSVLQIRELAVQQGPDAARELKQTLMDQVVRVLNCHMSPPPEQTPRELELSEAVKKYTSRFVSVLHDGRDRTSAANILQVDCLGNVVGAPPASFVRCADVEDMVELVRLQLREAKRPIWVGSTWSTDIFRQWDSLDSNHYVNDPEPEQNMNKISRIFDLGLDLGEHATCLVGSKVDNDGKLSELLVQNSHGQADQPPGHGHLRMHVDWFREYINIVVIDKSILQKFAGGKLLPAKPEVMVLECWDRIGTLA